MGAHTSVTQEKNSSAALSVLKWELVCGIKKGIQDCCGRIQAGRGCWSGGGLGGRGGVPTGQRRLCNPNYLSTRSGQVGPLEQGAVNVCNAERGNKSSQAVNKIYSAWTASSCHPQPPSLSPPLALLFGCGVQRATKPRARAFDDQSHKAH